MSNIAISSVCNLSCPYCFATTHMSAARQDRTPPFISLAQFERRLDFLERSGIEQVRLIGGEPTLHPEFAQLIDQIRARGMPVVIFSHGLMPEAALDSVVALPEEVCSVLVNMNASRSITGPNDQERRWRLETLKQLKRRAMLGFNIFQPSFDLDELLPVIEASGCRRVIRLGLAQPIAGGENLYLHPKQYPAAGAKIASWARRTAGEDVRLEFDCGFVHCMFSPQDRQALQEAGTNMVSHCGPILDIDIAGAAVHCFPLTGIIETPAANGASAGNLRQELRSQTGSYRVAGIYRECSSCVFKAEGICTGGCLAATMRRFHHQPFSIRLPSLESVS